MLKSGKSVHTNFIILLQNTHYIKHFVNYTDLKYKDEVFWNY
jgi:hypothetical protein